MSDIGSWVNPLITGIAGIAGVFVGAMMNMAAEKRKRESDFTTQQLRELYGPLLSLRSIILAHSKLRAKLETVADSSWRELVQRARDEGGVDALLRLKEVPDHSKYMSIVEEENKRFKEVIFPWYKKMLDVFHENFWLAEPATRLHFSELVEFVEVWDRFLQRTLPDPVTQKLDHSEANLHGFYKDIEDTHGRLIGMLARGTNSKGQ